ncbi:MAG: metal-dependent hydrolase [Oscillospiraceae bacterium]|nr:metal-dependent hydrolase [Oscillospiraceae bacterium]
MHSFLALLLLNIAISFICQPFVKYFTIGFLSHLGLDILNKRKLRLLYPRKKGFSLKLCPANGMVNYILFLVGSALSVAEIIIFLIRIVRN